MKPKVLFVSQSGPIPPLDGKRQRSLALIQALSRRYQVDYLILDHEEDFFNAQRETGLNQVQFLHLSTPSSKKDRLLHRLGIIYIQSRYLSRQIRDLCEREKYQFAFSRYIHPVLHLPQSLPVVADIDDDLEENYRSRIATAGLGWRKLRLWQILWINLPVYRRLLRRLALGFTVKPDRKGEQIRLLPNLPFQLLQQGQIQFSPSDSYNILFVGKLSYPPNLNGIKWFLGKVFPLVLKELPEMRLTLVSNVKVQNPGLNELIDAFPSVRILINQGDLIKIYREHSVSISPILEGAGSNIKVSESLYMGRPVITTTFGSRGFDDARGAVFLQESNTAIGFCELLVNLFKDPSRLEKTQLEAFIFAQQAYDLSIWKEGLLNDLENVK